MSDTRTFEIYRYDPDRDSRPYMQTYEIEASSTDRMLLDVLVRLKAQDETLSFRRSCREGVCGSDAMNINRKNGLACITNLNDLPRHTVLRPLPGLPVVRDLIVDMTAFFKQYHSIKPYLINDTPPPERERRQTPRSAISSMGSTSASCARAVPARVHHIGGIRTNMSVLPDSCRPIAFWSIPATKRRANGLTILTIRTAFSGAGRF